jgi:hypothetical protein
MVYKPGGVPPLVEMVRKTWAGGVAELGLTAHVGLPVGCTGVTEQGMVLNETELLKLPTAARLRVAVEDPPGSTADGESGLDTVSVNGACP